MTTLQEQAQNVLGGQYEIERELGGGGMSRVFVARDRQLDRRVVIKLLRPELAAGVSVDRFRREILLAASLQHPLIVPVLAAGELDGLPYFIMPFVDGESLRTRIHRSGMMNVPEAVRILRDVARALAVAHARGIVHRDIKPDNVLLAHEAAVVADFGVAKAFASARSSDDAPHAAHAITTIGTSLGTPAYMAPEQVAADPDATHSVDIYAFGVMAYEMLTGAPPFAGRAPQAIMAAQITEAPADIGSIRPGLPTALSSLVMSCLRKEARDRPATAAALVEALEDPAVVSGSFTPLPDDTASRERIASPGMPLPAASRRSRRMRMLAGAAALVAVTAVGAYVAVVQPFGRANDPADASRTAATPATTIAPSVAVLPFVFLGADSSQSWSAKAVADAITNGLSTIPGLRVASRSAADVLQRRLAAGDTAALNVATLVEGVVEREGDKVRISVRLVSATDGFTLFADRIEGDATGLFALEDELAESIRLMLRDHFGLSSRDSTARP